MDLTQVDIFDFEPQYLAPLITFIQDRNEAIGIPQISGILLDMYQFYYGYLADEKYYFEIIDFYQKGAEGKLNRLFELIKQGREEPDLFKKKHLLLEAMELEKQIDLFYSD